MLKSRSTWPPGGWKFREPKSGWSLPPGLGFQDSVKAIITHRQQNPRFGLPTDADVVANELDDYTCKILKNNPHWCVETSSLNFTLPPLEMPSLVEAKGSVAGVSKFLTNATAGIKTWIEWFGEGKTVEKVLADQRAVICSKCPENVQGNIVDKFTAVAAKEILSIFSTLNELDLHTENEDKLHICRACDCPLKAKVWAPLTVIKKHITKKAWSSLAEGCWMLHEKE